MAHTLTLHTRSPVQTERMGQCLVALLPMGSLVALRGELGSGKTCFVRGMARAFVHDPNLVSSPTFTLVNEYSGNKRLYHLDLYRLGDVTELTDLGYEELFEPVDGLCVVEWAERAGDTLPAHRVDVVFQHAGDDDRTITVTTHVKLPDYWQDLLTGVVHRGEPQPGA